MDEQEYREHLAEHLFPMLPGTSLGGVRTSRKNHSLVAYAGPCTLLLKPVRDADFRLPLVRSQAFTPEERRLVGLYSDELSAIVQQAGERYFTDALASLHRRVIGGLLAGERGRLALTRAIEEFEALASQTY